MSSNSDFVRLDSLSRRDALSRIALAITAGGLAGGLDRADAAQVHEQVESERTLEGQYTVKYFNEHEFKTLERLSELIVPEDEGGPSGRQGGAPEFIDLLTSQSAELASIFTGGMLWLDHFAGQRHGHAFVACTPDQQSGMLDALVEAERTDKGPDTRWETREYERFSVFGIRTPSDLRRGLGFFDWARRLIVDAYYTSPAGIKDLGFMGNAAHSQYEVPAEAIAYVTQEGPFEEIGAMPGGASRKGSGRACGLPSHQPEFRLAALLCSAALAWGTCATLCAQGPPDGTSAEIVRLVRDLSRSLQSGNAALFMRGFDSDEHVDHGLLREHVAALAAQRRIASSIAIGSIEEESGEVVVSVDWLVELSPKLDPGPIERRRETVELRLRKRRGRWMFVHVKPLDFFAPRLMKNQPPGPGG